MKNEKVFMAIALASALSGEVLMTGCNQQKQQTYNGDQPYTDSNDSEFATSTLALPQGINNLGNGDLSMILKPQIFSNDPAFNYAGGVEDTDLVTITNFVILPANQFWIESMVGIGNENNPRSRKEVTLQAPKLTESHTYNTTWRNWRISTMIWDGVNYLTGRIPSTPIPSPNPKRLVI